MLGVSTIGQLSIGQSIVSNSIDINPIPLFEISQTEFAFSQIDAHDPNNNPLTFKILPYNTEKVPDTENIPDTPGYDHTRVNVFHHAPIGLEITNEGLLCGGIEIENLPGRYYFTIEVSDGLMSTSKLFRVDVIGQPLLRDDYETPYHVRWVTEAGLLGELHSTYPSYFRVEVESSEEVEFFRSPASPPLPPGLTVQRNGLITGFVDYIPDDKLYTFVIRARLVNSPLHFIDREFSIQVRGTYSSPVSKVSHQITGDQKLDFNTWINGDDFLLNYVQHDLLFNDGIIGFGRVQNPEVYLISGLPVVSFSDFWDVIKGQYSGDLSQVTAEDVLSNRILAQSFHEPIEAIMGKMGSAVVRDSSGKILYDVIYIPLYDPNANAGGFDSNENLDPVPYTHHPNRFLFPKSIMNMRKNLISLLGLVDDYEHLPLWMTSPQELMDDGTPDPESALGYVPAIEVAYVQPTFGKTLLDNWRTRGLDQRFVSKKITVNKITYSDMTNVNSPRIKLFKYPPGDQRKRSNKE